ncbi:MAG: ammonium transporter [Acidimicrobiaceae bacterium]|jgi:Amt family ammonium transporter|nr:ammonium transporter [Acidimicrobiaceae bacterium]
MYFPYPSWLNPGDNSWQLTAATLVGLMSVIGIAALYGGLVKKKWAVNTLLMTFGGFAAVLVVWIFWAYDMGFGTPFHAGGGHGITSSILNGFIGHPGSITGPGQETDQAIIPNFVGVSPPFHFPTATLAYFQFVFAAITPLLFLGSVLGRMNFKAWIVFVPCWTTCAYTVNAMLVWGGGYWAQKGALDYSGGYVIHLAAGVSGFVAAWVVGPRSMRDRQSFPPTNLLLVAVGAGMLWMGWNGFNGGDPYYAGTDAAAAIMNTNICTATALLTWVLCDTFISPAKKPTFLGSVNGMIVGLVCITPAAGFVNGNGAAVMGVIASFLIFLAWTYLPKVRPFSKVDDALGVVYTHGMAGLLGGIMTGFLADPYMVEYATGKTNARSLWQGGNGAAGLLYGNSDRVLIQFLTALTIIVWDAVVTFVLLMIIKYVLRIKLRFTDAEIEIGDAAVHDEEVEPPQLATRSGIMETLAPEGGV